MASLRAPSIAAPPPGGTHNIRRPDGSSQVMAEMMLTTALVLGAGAGLLALVAVIQGFASARSLDADDPAPWDVFRL